MDAVRVDPRDARWEIDQPRYRVYFHDLRGIADEYEVRADDVGEVLDWAEAERGMRTYVVYACVPRRGLGLVRLTGRDPNNSDQL